MQQIRIIGYRANPMFQMRVNG